MIEISTIWNLICARLTESELVKNLNELSMQFTVRRGDLDRYTQDEKLVAAYSAFYLPTNMPKFKFLMDQLEPKIREQISQSHFWDFGSGPGTFSLAYLDYFSRADDLKVTLVDSSKLMLSQARLFLSSLFPKRMVKYLDKLPKEIQGKKTLLFGHSFNEIGYQRAIEIIRQVDPDYLIMIEPGTKEVFSYINDLRIYMREHGYACLYPCLNLHSDCPMTSRLSDWCHGVMRMVHDPDLERLSQLIKKDRRNMPFIAHVYQKGSWQSDSDKGTEQARLVRFLNNSKFGFEVEVCLCKENDLVIEKIQLLKKDMTKEEIKKFENINVGSKLTFTVIKKFDDFIRVKLSC